MEIRVGSHTTLTLTSGVHDCTRDEFASFETFMTSVSATPNNYRPTTNILRRQCAVFLPCAPIHTYEFGQKQDSLVCDVVDMHPLLSRLFRSIPSEYNMVQCNYYEHAGVGISPHQDNEACIDSRYPILSVSFYADPHDSRKFSIYTLQGCKIVDIVLRHGDLLEMKGQEECKHGIDKERRTSCGPRINFTFRVAT